MLPRSLHCAAGAPNCGAKEKTGRSGRDDGEEKPKSTGRNACATEVRLGCWIAFCLGLSTARPDARKARERKNRAAPVGMTEERNPRAQAGMPVPQKSVVIGSGVGDFAEDGGAAGAGGGGEIGGAMVEGFVGKEGEGVGFFGGFGNAEMGGGKDFDGVMEKMASGEWRAAR
jgi:hypothetical protein